MNKEQKERKRRFREQYKYDNMKLSYPQYLEWRLERLEACKSLDSLASSFRELRFQLYVNQQTTCAELRKQRNHAREHAELVTAVLMYLRGKGKMPRNWRSLTIGELLGFATTLPKVESLGELSEIPIMSRKEADFIQMMETLARCGMENKELPADDPCNWWWNIQSGAFWTLLRKAKAMLCVDW